MRGPCQLGPLVAGEPEGPRDGEMADELDWLDLPGRWTYGVDPGGRVFFIRCAARLLYSFVLISLKLSNLKGGGAGGWLGRGEEAGAGTAGMTNKFITGLFEWGSRLFQVDQSPG